jgi:predicted TIM-barrel fold metal-dependent hydrolase
MSSVISERGTAPAGGTSTTTKPVVFVSADSHVGPRAAEDLRQYCPKALLDDYDAWLVAVTEAGKDSAYDHRHAGNPGRIARLRLNDIPGHYDMNARIADMNRDSVAGSVVFHGSQNLEPLPFLDSVGTRLFRTGGPDEIQMDKESLEKVKIGLRMYNHWLSDVCSIEPERHAGLVHLPMWDLDAALEELRWGHEHGLRGVNFPAPRAGVANFDDPVWAPFWNACEEFGMPLTTHAGVGNPADWVGPISGVLSQLEATGFNVVKGLHRLIFAGVFERHPKLNIVYTEQAAQPSHWWPGATQEYDHVWKKRHWQVGELCPRPPSEYMRDHVFLGASFLHRAPDEPWKAQRGGWDRNVLWGSDYPHTEGALVERGDGTSTIRTSLAWIFSGTDERAVRRIAGKTAAELYGMDYSALQKVAGRINAPTMEDLAEAPAEEDIPDYWDGDD